MRVGRMIGKSQSQAEKSEIISFRGCIFLSFNHPASLLARIYRTPPIPVNILQLVQLFLPDNPSGYLLHIPSSILSLVSFNCPRSQAGEPSKKQDDAHGWGHR